MRKQDKKIKIQKANFLFEQRYLSNKAFDKIEETLLSENKLDLNSENEVSKMKSMLFELVLENLPQFNFYKTGDKATSNDNKVIFITKILPNFFESVFIPLDYRSNNREIWTNNSEAMKEYLTKIGENPERFTFWNSSNKQI